MLTKTIANEGKYSTIKITKEFHKLPAPLPASSPTCFKYCSVKEVQIAIKDRPMNKKSKHKNQEVILTTYVVLVLNWFCLFSETMYLYLRNSCLMFSDMSSKSSSLVGGDRRFFACHIGSLCGNKKRKNFKKQFAKKKFQNFFSKHQK